MQPDQGYYRTDEWQAAEKESLDALARGEGRVFATAQDAIEWLQDDD